MSRYRSQIREVINRNTVVSLALAQGFNAFLPVYDGGVDFILYREGDPELLSEPELRKVQLKARWTIDKKYIGRDIWIAFPVSSDWYLIQHDKMVEMAEVEGITKTNSWINDGLYSRPTLSAKVLQRCAPYQFRPKANADRGFEDRITWKEGDLVFVDKDDNPIEIPKIVTSIEEGKLSIADDDGARTASTPTKSPDA